MDREPAHSISKRGRLGEGRPTKRTPEVVAKIAEVIAMGLTDEEAALLAGVNPDTMTERRKDPEFSGAIKKATAQRLLLRLERIEAGKRGGRAQHGRHAVDCHGDVVDGRAGDRLRRLCSRLPAPNLGPPLHPTIQAGFIVSRKRFGISPRWSLCRSCRALDWPTTRLLRRRIVRIPRERY